MKLSMENVKIIGFKQYGSLNFNYKKEHSIVIMALVGRDYCLQYIGWRRFQKLFENNTPIPHGGIIVWDAASPA